MDPVFDDVVRVEQCSLVTSNTYFIPLIPRNTLLLQSQEKTKKPSSVIYKGIIYCIKTTNE